MTEKTMLKAVPSPELSPADVLNLAKQDCDVWLELGFEEVHASGSKLFRAFSEAVRGISEAVKKEGVSSSVNRFAELCSEMNASSNTEAAPVDADGTLADEIARRQEWLAELTSSQMNVEEVLEIVEVSLKKASDNVRFTDKPTAKLIAAEKAARDVRDSVQEFSLKLSALRKQVQSEVETLQRYKRALDLVAKGYPEELVGGDMPEIPVFAEEAGKDVVFPETPDLPKRESGASASDYWFSQPDEKPAVEASVPITERRLKLREIADQFGFLEVEVFVYSLFDFLGTNNELLTEQGRRNNRGVNRVVGTALEIAADYGWHDAHDFFPGSGWKKDTVISDGYLRYIGHVGKTPTWVRADKPLPWNPKFLLTETEIAAFVSKMREKLVFVPKESKGN